MTTLAIMKARIADEIMRDDLTSQIGYAISDAIKFYQRKRLYFNETDAITFPTVAAQYEYTSADNSSIPNIYDLDEMTINVSSNNYQVSRISPELWRSLYNGSTSGQPCNYAWINQVIRLYPTPDAVWTVRIQAHYKLSEPASESEANNKWMTDAEELIRFRAKAILFRDVLYDVEKAVISTSAEADALNSLCAISNTMVRTGLIVPMAF